VTLLEYPHLPVELARIQRHVTYAGALEVVRAGLATAADLGVNASIVVTDANGEIVAAGKTEAGGAAGWRGGLMKATFAARLGVPTEDFIENRLKQDDVLWRAMETQEGTFIVPGGFPLLFEGKSIGGVGVSGGHYRDDAKVAKAGADRFAELLAEAAPSTK
jgi:uncharacterized protein GlcG (DUF336 family)